MLDEERFDFIPVTPGRLPARLLRIAGAITFASAKNPGFWTNHVHTGVALRLDLQSPSLDEPLRVRLEQRFPRQSEILIVERELRGQLANVTAAIAKLDEAVGDVFEGV